MNNPKLIKESKRCFNSFVDNIEDRPVLEKLSKTQLIFKLRIIKNQSLNMLQTIKSMEGK